MRGRPASPKVRYFQRQLGSAERKVLLLAGSGDISLGFLEIIDCYRHFYGLGLRPDTPLEDVVLVIPKGRRNNASKTPSNASGEPS